MAASGTDLERLIVCLGKLPGVGRRSAERMATRLILNSARLMDDLIAALNEARNTTCCCSRCGSITANDRNPCSLCTSSTRDGEVLCVVEEPGDIALIENSGGYRGRYHALMGKLSPMKRQGPDEIRVGELVKRVRDENFKEVVLALSTDVEGDATSSFLADILQKMNVRVTRLAYGLPARSGISYSDPVTLARAIKGRTEER